MPHVKIASSDLQSAHRLGFGDRNAVQLLFQAAENLTLAALTAENIDLAAARRASGGKHHQLDDMVDLLPDACVAKSDLDQVSILTTYATTYRYPTTGGRIPSAPDAKQARQWFDHLTALLQTFCTHFGVDPRDNAPVAKSVAPMRQA